MILYQFLLFVLNMKVLISHQPRLLAEYTNTEVGRNGSTDNCYGTYIGAEAQLVIDIHFKIPACTSH